MRWMRFTACSSTAGFHQGSSRYSVCAATRLSPTPPARSERSRMRGPSRDAKRRSATDRACCESLPSSRSYCRPSASSGCSTRLSIEVHCETTTTLATASSARPSAHGACGDTAGGGSGAASRLDLGGGPPVLLQVDREAGAGDGDKIVPLDHLSADGAERPAGGSEAALDALAAELVRARGQHGIVVLIQADDALGGRDGGRGAVLIGGRPGVAVAELAQGALEEVGRRRSRDGSVAAGLLVLPPLEQPRADLANVGVGARPRQDEVRVVARLPELEQHVQHRGVIVEHAALGHKRVEAHLRLRAQRVVKVALLVGEEQPLDVGYAWGQQDDGRAASVARRLGPPQHQRLERRA
eukprot:scaffold1690_cov118-Isochrysis_galbana.AAC.2